MQQKMNYPVLWCKNFIYGKAEKLWGVAQRQGNIIKKL